MKVKRYLDETTGKKCTVVRQAELFYCALNLTLAYVPKDIRQTILVPLKGQGALPKKFKVR